MERLWSFSDLSDEIALHIFSYIGYGDVEDLRRVSKEWLRLLKDDRLCSSFALILHPENGSDLAWCDRHDQIEVSVKCRKCRRNVCPRLGRMEETYDIRFPGRGFMCLKCLHDAKKSPCRKGWRHCLDRKDFSVCMEGKCVSCTAKSSLGEMRFISVGEKVRRMFVCNNCNFNVMKQCSCMREACFCSTHIVLFETKTKKEQTMMHNQGESCKLCKDHCSKKVVSVSTMSLHDLVAQMVVMRGDIGDYSFKTIQSCLLKLYIYLHNRSIPFTHSCHIASCYKAYLEDETNVALYGHLLQHFYSSRFLLNTFYNRVATILFKNVEVLNAS